MSVFEDLYYAPVRMGRYRSASFSSSTYGGQTGDSLVRTTIIPSRATVDVDEDTYIPSSAFKTAMLSQYTIDDAAAIAAKSKQSDANLLKSIDERLLLSTIPFARSRSVSPTRETTYYTYARPRARSVSPVRSEVVVTLGDEGKTSEKYYPYYTPYYGYRPYSYYTGGYWPYYGTYRSRYRRGYGWEPTHPSYFYLRSAKDSSLDSEVSDYLSRPYYSYYSSRYLPSYDYDYDYYPSYRSRYYYGYPSYYGYGGYSGYSGYSWPYYSYYYY